VVQHAAGAGAARSRAPALCWRVRSGCAAAVAKRREAGAGVGEGSRPEEAVKPTESGALVARGCPSVRAGEAGAQPRAAGVSPGEVHTDGGCSAASRV
jgi:hypothetical protein